MASTIRSLAQALMDPQQRIHVRPGRDVLQSIITMAGKRYFLRVIVDVDRSPAQVVTVYRTSKIAKYWSQEP